MSASPYDFDLFVIGGGSGGVRASRVAASLGARVALAERDRMGGTCVNVGCVPKKLYVYGAEVAHQLEDARGFGWTIGDRSHDWATLRANVAAEVKRLEGIYDRIVTSAGVELLRGEARLDAPHRVIVRSVSGEERVITAEHVLVATGSAARRPSYEGAELAWLSDDLFTLDRLPASVVVIGSGYIALEFAAIFAAHGVEVDVLARSGAVLRGFDGAVSSFVKKALELQGVRVHLEEDVARIERVKDRLVVHTKRARRFEAERVLAAIGRDPLTRGLGLDRVGVTLDPSGAIPIDDGFETSVRKHYAVGDVAGRAQLTPVALAEGMALARRLFGGVETKLDYDLVPTAVFTTPAVGTVGLTEEEARRRGHALRIFESEFRPMKATVSGSADRSLMKLVVDRDSDRVLGVHVVGEGAAEIVQGFAVALTACATKRQFDQTIGIHPTSAEELVTMRTPSRVDP